MKTDGERDKSKGQKNTRKIEIKEECERKEELKDYGREGKEREREKLAVGGKRTGKRKEKNKTHQKERNRRKRRDGERHKGGKSNRGKGREERKEGRKRM